MLAAELTLAKVDVAILERRASQDVDGSRAGGLHARTIEVLDQRGIADRFLSEGQVAQVVELRRGAVGHQRLPHPAPLRARAVAEPHRAHPGRWVGELQVPIHRGREVTGFAQDDAGVDVELSDGESLRAQYLVGCDGGRSLIRKLAGIEFPGWDPTTSSLIAEAEMADEPELGLRRDDKGIHAIGPLDDGRAVPDRGARSAARPHRRADPPRSQRGARSPSAERITDCTVRAGSPGSPI